MPKTTPTPKSLKPCSCSVFEVGTETETDGQPDRTIETTGCTQQTRSAFAQGHDAKLVSFLVRAEFEGLTIWRTDGGMLTTHSGASNAAGSISPALAVKADRMLTNMVGKAEARRTREAQKAEARANKAAATHTTPTEVEVVEAILGGTPDPQPTEARIKVGRWTYDATIGESGVAMYSTKLGQTKAAQPGEYTIA